MIIMQFCEHGDFEEGFCFECMEKVKENMAEHYKVLCKECTKLMSQCRCPDQNKKIHYETCDDCKNKNAK
jgi:hypothetical protein